MLYAAARSVREERSKQRYALQDFSLVRVSLVKGKAGWKIGSIEAQKNYYHDAVDKLARGSVVSVFRLLRRFLKGEEAARELFDYVLASLDELVEERKYRQFLQMVIQVHILAELGYVDRKSIPSAVQSASPANISNLYNQSLIKQVEDVYTNAVSVSHL